MATKYIEADKVEKITWEEPSYWDPLNVLTEVRDKVRELPAADVVSMDRYINAIKTINMMSKVLEDFEPVKHGRWIKNDNGTYSCSECQSWIPNEQHHYARYCLHCGARMDEVEE